MVSKPTFLGKRNTMVQTCMEEKMEAHDQEIDRPQYYINIVGEERRVVAQHVCRVTRVS